MNVQVNDSMIKAFLAVKATGRVEMVTMEAMNLAQSICPSIDIVHWYGILANETDCTKRIS